MKRGEWHALSMIYWEQARQLYEEGKPHLDLARQASKASLQVFVQGGYVRNVEIVCNCCAQCQRDAGRKMALAGAVRELPIPHETCDNDGWCICFVLSTCAIGKFNAVCWECVDCYSAGISYIGKNVI